MWSISALQESYKSDENLKDETITATGSLTANCFDTKPGHLKDWRSRNEVKR
jgi:hypothetical protein